MSDLPRVVHINDKVPGAVYVGRANGRKRLKASPFANPYKIGQTLPTFEGLHDRKATRQDVVTMYRHWLLLKGPIGDLSELRNAPALACWCRHDGEERTDDNVCHADVLVELLAKFRDEDLQEIVK